MAGFSSVGLFLFSLFFSTFTFILLGRFLLTFFKLSPFHPIRRQLTECSEPLVAHLKFFLDFLPLPKHPQIDWGCLASFILVVFIKFLALNYVFLQSQLSLGVVMLLTLGDLIIQPCQIIFYCIIIRILLTWFNPIWQSPLTEIIIITTEPILMLGRKLIPSWGHIDFSPFLILIGLKSITIFINSSLPIHIF